MAHARSCAGALALRFAWVVAADDEDHVFLERLGSKKASKGRWSRFWSAR
jgi:hypothetical protein